MTRKKAVAEVAAEAGKERPKYQLTEKAYIDDTMHDPESPELMDPRTKEYDPLIIEYDGRPGAHMKPMNAPAKAMYAKYPPKTGDVLEALTVLDNDRRKDIKDIVATSK